MTTARQGVRLEWRGEEIAAGVRRGAVKATKDTISEAVDIAKRLVRVDTGELRESIEATPVSETYDGVSASFGTDKPHALPNELGTYKMSAQPFLRPAADIAFRRHAGRVSVNARRFGGY